MRVSQASTRLLRLFHRFVNQNRYILLVLFCFCFFGGGCFVLPALTLLVVIADGRIAVFDV